MQVTVANLTQII